MNNQFNNLISESNSVSLKEVWNKFYELRKFEIENLWQRSIFLSALLVLSFTGYGYLLSQLISPTTDKIILHEICGGVSICGVIFSVVWVMMAKASKAWYEVYERRIDKIEKKLNIRYQMGGKCMPWTLDQNLLSTNTGKYSPSKLNIVIGIAMMIIWVIILIIHYILIIINFDKSNCILHTVILTLFPVVFLLLVITAMCNTWAKSGSLQKPSDNEYVLIIHPNE